MSIHGKSSVAAASASGPRCGNLGLAQHAAAAKTSNETKKLRVCGICWRDETFPNRMPNRFPDDDTLKMANSTQCLSCRNMCNGPLKGRDAAQVRSQTAKYEKKRAEMRELVEKHEDQMDQGKAGVAFKDDGSFVPPAWLDRLQSQGVEETKFGHVFWQRSLLVQKGIPFEEADLRPHKRCNEKGLYRDRDQGTPTGAIGCDFLWEDKILKKQRPADSKSELVEGQVEEQFDRIAAATGTLSHTVVTTEAGTTSLCTSIKGATSTGNDDHDDLGDFLPTVGLLLAAPSTPDATVGDTIPSRAKRAKTKAKGDKGCKGRGAAPPVRGGVGAKIADKLKQKQENTQSATKAAALGNATKVYPSQQGRAIARCEESLAECKAKLDQLQTEDGISTASAAKVMAAIKKCSAKVEDDSTMRMVLARNAVQTDNEPRDLQKIGKEMVDRGTKLCEGLRLAHDVVESMESSDDTDIRSTAAFLLRAYTDAKAGGVDIPVTVLATVVDRHVRVLLDERRYQEAISATDETQDIAHDLQLLKASPKALEGCKYELFGLIMHAVMDRKFADESDSSDQVDSATPFDAMVALKSMEAASSKFDVLRKVVDAAITAADAYNRDEVAVQAAVQLLTNEGEAPEPVQRVFKGGPGRDLLVAARNVSIPKTVDAGYSLSVLWGCWGEGTPGHQCIPCTTSFTHQPHLPPHLVPLAFSK